MVMLRVILINKEVLHSGLKIGCLKDAFGFRSVQKRSNTICFVGPLEANSFRWFQGQKVVKCLSTTMMT